MNVQLLTHTPEPEKIIASAAKLCYSEADIKTLMDGLTEEKIESFIKRLSDLGHESPIEHITFTFGIEGVSLALLAQITRHRIASYSVQSQRYVNMSDFNFVTPPAISNNSNLCKLYNDFMDDTVVLYDVIKNGIIIDLIFTRYKKEAKEIFRDICLSLNTDVEETEKTLVVLDKFWNEYYPNRDSEIPDFMKNNISFWEQTALEKFKEQHKDEYRKISKEAQEDARFVLPNACETKIIVTMNARSLMNFFKLRCCTRAQWEIREVANKMLQLVKEVAPEIFKNAGPACKRGPCPEGAMSCKNKQN